jgi:hypothetical protein
MNFCCTGCGRNIPTVTEFDSPRRERHGVGQAKQSANSLPPGWRVIPHMRIGMPRWWHALCWLAAGSVIYATFTHGYDGFGDAAQGQQ